MRTFAVGWFGLGLAACLACSGGRTSDEGVRTRLGQNDPDPVGTGDDTTAPSAGGSTATPPPAATATTGTPPVASTAEPPPSPPDAGTATLSDDCWFEFLGDWVRCEETWSSPSAGDLFETVTDCSTACLGDDRCNTIIDYNWIDPLLGCYTNLGSCTPSTGVSYEEDAAREYRKVCGSNPPSDAIFAFSDEPGLVADPTSGCRYVSIGDYKSCENDVPYSEATVTGATFEECLQACEARTDCGAVKNWWLNGPTQFECALHLSTCDAPVSGNAYGETARFFAKRCDAVTTP